MNSLILLSFGITDSTVIWHFQAIDYIERENLGLTRSLHGDLKWRGVHANRRAVVKDLTHTGSRPRRSLDRISTPNLYFLGKNITKPVASFGAAAST